MAIFGRPEMIAKARAKLAELVPVTEAVAVPNAMHRGLIGKKGADIQQFQQDHDVNLKVAVILNVLSD